MPRRSRTLIGLAVLYALALAMIALWPTPVDRPIDGLIADVMRQAHDLGVPAWVGYGHIDFLANVALFAPFGFFVSAIIDTHPAIAALIGLATSVAIEVLQLVLRPERFATPADVVANTLGAVIGVGVAHLSTSRPRVRPNQLGR